MNDRSDEDYPLYPTCRRAGEKKQLTSINNDGITLLNGRQKMWADPACSAQVRILGIKHVR
ncbi:hypothetical protein ACLK1S_15720 [Escherichia coli]